MSILEEAAELINGDRASTYGDVTENFQRIADMWTAYKGVEVPFTAYDVSNMMILVKVARLATGGYHRDSVADIAGYAGLSEQINDKATAVAGPFALALFDSVITHPPIETKPFWQQIVDGVKDLVDQLAPASEVTSFNISVAEKPETSPRVWQSEKDIPDGVVVVDQAGDEWKWQDGVRYLRLSLSALGWDGGWVDPDREDMEEGPYTEVLESKKPEPRVVDELTFDLVTDGTVWADGDTDLIKVRSGSWWRKYHDDDDGWVEMDSFSSRLPRYATKYPPYTEVLEPA